MAPDSRSKSLIMQLSILLVVVLAAVLATPFLAGLYQSAAIRRRRAELRQALNTVREYEFIPVEFQSLAEPVRQQLERHTPPMLQLGLKQLDDYRMKPPPVEVHDRFFLSPEGDILGDISALVGKGGVTFISVLTDGTCVNTTSSKNYRPDRLLEETDQLVLTYAGCDDVVELYRQHVTILNEAAKRQNTPVVRFSPNQLRALMVYDQRLFNRWRHRHGDFATAPPAPNFATLESAQ